MTCHDHVSLHDLSSYVPGAAPVRKGAIISFAADAGQNRVDPGVWL